MFIEYLLSVWYCVKGRIRVILLNVYNSFVKIRFLSVREEEIEVLRIEVIFLKYLVFER